VKRVPTHAGKLSAWERLVFTAVFVLMAAFVVEVTMSAAKSGGTPEAAGPGRSAGPTSVIGAGVQPLPATGGGVKDVGVSGGATSSHARARRTDLDRKLAAALRPVLSGGTGHLSVGVIDVSTGAEAVYGARRHFHTASIEKADILAALLLEHQRAGTLLTGLEARLAGPMIENSDDKAANRLWLLAGGSAGVAAVNRQLGLLHTVSGPSDLWGLTSTTVTDQLQLLAELTQASSLLSPASRDYELGLMENVQAGQRWGVSAAATTDASYPIKDGWLPDPALWVLNSIGIVEHGRQQLLIAVLSDGQPTEAAGIRADSAAAAAAARVITRN
jgi:beta-lactamase class A